MQKVRQGGKEEEDAYVKGTRTKLMKLSQLI